MSHSVGQDVINDFHRRKNEEEAAAAEEEMDATAEEMAVAGRRMIVG